MPPARLLRSPHPLELASSIKSQYCSYMVTAQADIMQWPDRIGRRIKFETSTILLAVGTKREHVERRRILPSRTPSC